MLTVPELCLWIFHKFSDFPLSDKRSLDSFFQRLPASHCWCWQCVQSGQRDLAWIFQFTAIRTHSLCRTSFWCLSMLLSSQCNEVTIEIRKDRLLEFPCGKSWVVVYLQRIWAVNASTTLTLWLSPFLSLIALVWQTIKPVSCSSGNCLSKWNKPKERAVGKLMYRQRWPKAQAKLPVGWDWHLK